MLSNAFSQPTQKKHLIRLVLVFALVFAAVHVAFHDLDVVSGGDLVGNGECQICRLNHVQTASADPSLITRLHFLLYVLPVTDTEYQLTPRFDTYRVRAPPLF